MSIIILRLLAVITLAATVLSPVTASELEGDYLYKVSTIRAAPGSLAQLLDWVAELEAAGYFTDSGEQRPLIMRHSQGDHWDLMIITPMKSWTSFHSESSVQKRSRAVGLHAELLQKSKAMIAFDEDHFAFGPPLSAINKAYDENNFFHIEMFEAMPGTSDKLTEQRRMENAYLAATDQTANMIFRRAGGSDVDVFTIGFHKSLEAFVAPASVTDDEKEIAAKAAGFEDRSDISYYLRSLISGHHDTLAVKVDAATALDDPN